MGSYNYYKMFGCFNRKFKISEAEPPPDVRDAFGRYSEGGAYMKADQLLKFLVEYQQEVDCTAADAEAIMQGVFRHRHHSAKRPRPGLTLDDFFHFLFQDDFNNPILYQVHQDMTAPLQHYFIYTGHNSYLTGNQLSSDCSEIPIIKSLENGVRGIELDLWPNSAKDKIHVLHGRTLTTPIPLMKCLKSIKEHAFVKSPYPVIITLEDHLTPELQAKVAEMVIQIFGDLLYYPESGCLDEFPSPEELKHKIILSTKPPKEYLESKITKDQDTLSPREKDSSDDELSVRGRGMSEPTAEPEADVKNDSGRDDEGINFIEQKSGNITAPEFKRLTAIDTEKVKHGLMPAIHNGSDHGNESGSIMDLDIPSPIEKDFSKDELSFREMLDRSAKLEAEVEGDSYQDDIDHIQQKSSNIATPEFKRLTAINSGNLQKDLWHTPRTDCDIVNPKAYLGRKDTIEQDISSPRGKDFLEDEVSLREMLDPTSVLLTNNKSDSNQDGIDPIQQKAVNMAAPEFKRLTAFNTEMAKDDLRYMLRNDFSFDDPEEYLETKDAKDQHISSPMEKESYEDELSLRETSDPSSELEVDVKSENESDRDNMDSMQHKSGNMGVPEFRRLTAIHTGKSKKGLRHALSNDSYLVNPKNTKYHQDISFEVELSLSTLHPAAEPEADDKSDSDQEDEDIGFARQKSDNMSAPEYKRLIAIHAGKVKKGLRHALRNVSGKVNRLSLSEQTLERAAGSYPMDVVRFSQKNILRVFPKGTRVTSSNFDPTIGWMHGAQMIAFNMQGYGKSLWTMHGMFRSNGGCGYVKKPDILMKRGPNDVVFDPKIPLPVKKTLKVKVYMGDGWRLDFSHTHFDSFSPPDFYTKVQIIGVPADAAKRKTRIIEDDWGPYWDEEFSFPLSVPELALLRIEVREHDISDKDDFGGQTCLPIPELKPGIRAVPLHDKKGQKLKSVRLLMRFQFQ
ncbi:phosphoinositide phospholipase C 6-like isoform X2 [Primulina eburnea]|uniref:phosphoinositide phospholipase C 6-like isoform X2 n=1 Tax=Primulina eburnea TaxID=1245227 RepID=UPI003C6C2DC9